jgi:hypothetical protein
MYLGEGTNIQMIALIQVPDGMEESARHDGYWKLREILVHKTRHKPSGSNLEQPHISPVSQFSVVHQNHEIPNCPRISIN